MCDTITKAEDSPAPEATKTERLASLFINEVQQFHERILKIGHGEKTLSSLDEDWLAILRDKLSRLGDYLDDCELEKKEYEIDRRINLHLSIEVEKEITVTVMAHSEEEADEMVEDMDDEEALDSVGEEMPNCWNLDDWEVQDIS